MFCNQPFNRIEIYENGDVYCCCPIFINYYKIGNIYKNTFDEIWNGEKIKVLREKILKEDFSLCNDICINKYSNLKNEKYNSAIVNEYPEDISISSDSSCNIKCQFCRDENYHITFKKDEIDNEIETKWLPIFKNAQMIRFGCSGEPFASYKEMSIIKKVAENYPKIQFHIHTNGILGTKEKLNELKIYNRINTITVSLHSSSFWTYKRIIRGGNYFQVLKNLKLYSKMKEQGLIQNLRMIFVVYSENYKDMINFVKLTKKFNATAEFWALRKSDANICKEFDKYSIVNPNHKKHKELLKILSNPIFDNDNVILYPELKHLKDNV